MAEDFFEDIYHDTVPKHSAVTRKFFKPWHKPRKQYIRKHQWMAATLNLVSRIGESLRNEGRPFRYFSLPGIDMLDVRELMVICNSNGIPLKFLGFDINEIEQHISWDEIRRHIDSTSVLSKCNFCEITDRTSIAYNTMRKIGPFDLVNIDLCDSTGSPSMCFDYHTAILNFIEYQLDSRVDPWVFLLTTRADRGAVAETVMDRYQVVVSENVTHHNSFRNRLNAAGISVDENNKVDINDQNHSKVFSICFGKWLLSLVSQNPSWNIEMLDSYWYRVNRQGNQPDMLSLAFLLTKDTTTLIDRTQLARVSSSQETTPIERHEEQQALNIVDKTSVLLNVDEHLSNNRDVFEDMLQDSARLMNAARYPRDNYIRWAKVYGEADICHEAWSGRD